MSKILRKQSKKAGLPPGSLIHVGDILRDKSVLSMIDFNGDQLIERDDITIEDCLKHIQDETTITWINIRGICDASIIELLGKQFQLDPLILEDVMNSSQRSKLDDYKSYIFIIVRALFFLENKGVQDQQISIVLGKNYLLSFLEDATEIFNPIKERLRNKNKRIRALGADYLCYALIDTIVDHYFLILEGLDLEIETLEEDLIKTPTPATMRKIQHLKREIILLRKSIWPMREVINKFRRIDSPLIQESTQLYMHDVYDHTIQAIDTIESFRDLAAGMLDIYISGVNQHLNEIMKVLTMVATIFVPLTFIASIYGMNFNYMPELNSPWGYPIILCIMVGVACTMLYLFKRRKWL